VPFPPLPIYYAFFLQNYLGVTGFGPSWSLCVEEHFYLCLPIVVFLFARLRGVKILEYILPILFFVPLVLRLTSYWVDANMYSQWYFRTHLHFEGLIAGVWLAYLFVFNRTAFDRFKKLCRWLLPIPVVLVLVLPFWSPRPMLFDLLVNNLLALGFAAWLRSLYDLKWEPPSRTGKLVYWCVQGTALCSYSIYLTHAIFDPWLRALLEPLLTRGAVRTLIVMSATWMVGVIFYFVVERPTIKTRDRYLRRTKAVGTNLVAARMESRI
jgi:peptidoglycan/LPS O-acetylase OafA/YrhL